MKILFLGNSFTYYNDLPEMLSMLSNGVLSCASVTRGGAHLSEYSDADSEVRKKLDALLSGGERFDFVVLQEQSLLPAKDAESMLEASKAIANLIPDTRFVLYQTWSYERHSEKLLSTGFSFEEMTERLAEGYRKVSEEIGAAVVPVGEAFAEAERRDLRLYRDDHFHPDTSGTYLAACLFYRAFTGKNAAGLADAADLTPDVASELRKVANRMSIPDLTC